MLDPLLGRVDALGDADAGYSVPSSQGLDSTPRALGLRTPSRYSVCDLHRESSAYMSVLSRRADLGWRSGGMALPGSWTLFYDWGCDGGYGRTTETKPSMTCRFIHKANLPQLVVNLDLRSAKVLHSILRPSVHELGMH